MRWLIGWLVVSATALGWPLPWPMASREPLSNCFVWLEFFGEERLAQIQERYRIDSVISWDGSWARILRGRMPDISGVHYPEIGGPGAFVAIKIPFVGLDPDRNEISLANIVHEANMLAYVYRFERRRSRYFVRGVRDPQLNVLVMEQLVGALTLERWLGRRPLPAAIDRVLAELDGVQTALRGANLVHGDLHHENVLVMPDGSVRVVDFAFAASVGERPPHLRGLRLGTAGYLSDNQAANGPAALEDDAFALDVLRMQLRARR